MQQALKQYALVTLNYWAFTLTDGALRMLVVLYFHQIGYSPLEIAFLFIFYEAFGVVTNLFGGWLGARIGLNRTMNIGLLLQIISLSVLAMFSESISMALVMAAQALSGIAKDLNKMSAKSSIKGLVDQNQQSRLYKWIALLTGSKNALKGVGFFLGGFLLSSFGFEQALIIMAMGLSLMLTMSLIMLHQGLGKASYKPKFRDVFSKSKAINLLSLARFFLFGSRDVWFVIALPVYLSMELLWSHWQVSSILALWVIGYGVVQAFAPKLTSASKLTDKHSVRLWASILSICTLTYAATLKLWPLNPVVVITGIFVFGFVFAVNSSLHSYLVVNFAKSDGASLDVGFYYMANAMGRLVGTLLSGWIFQSHGLMACVIVSAVMLLLTCVVTWIIPFHQSDPSEPKSSLV